MARDSGDRGWAVYDETRNGITGAKRLPPLRGCHARYVVEPVSGAAAPVAEITFPDGAGVRSDSADAAGRLAESVWDERRFRPNLVVDVVDSTGYPELGWIGRRVRVGNAVIEVVTGCPRCVMVTQPVDDVPQDHRVMRTLVRETKHTAGIYARVAEEGEVRAGDEIEILP